jgi:hypothetical protein
VADQGARPVEGTQSQASSLIIGAREANGWDDDRLVSMVAGLAEPQPSVDQWHAAVEQTDGGISGGLLPGATNVACVPGRQASRRTGRTPERAGAEDYVLRFTDSFGDGAARLLAAISRRQMQ